MLTDEQIRLYLDRIEYTEDAAATLSTLKKLQLNHLKHIPYENLDIINGVPLSLETKDLFHKMILNKRGGYCFELQGLYRQLLVSLGYTLTQYSGRFMNEPKLIQMRRHRILVVDLDNKRYLCDVGVRNESPRQPLELAEGVVQSDGVSSYRFDKDSFYGWVLMQKETGKDWKLVYGFTEEPQIDIDYIMPSFFCEKHPDSTFNKFMKISIFTDCSNITIVGNTYKTYQKAKTTERQNLRTNEEAKKVLVETFGIEVPDDFHNFLWYDK